MEWYLILALYLQADKSGIALDHMEYQTEELCNAAGTKMAKEWSRGSLSWLDQSRFVCVRRTNGAPSTIVPSGK